MQLQKYYENRDDVTPALKLQLCVVQQEDKVYSTEPLVQYSYIALKWKSVCKFENIAIELSLSL
jgi:hypothetical protein